VAPLLSPPPPGPPRRAAAPRRPAPPPAASPALLRTVDALDDARGYCFDISGAGSTLDLGAPLQAHTCKGPGTVDDQLFESAAGETLRASRYDRCLQAEALEAGATLYLRVCDGSREQRWTFSDGRLTPELARALCVSLGADSGEPWGTPRLVSPVYRRQALALARCDPALARRQTFRWLSESELTASSADRARAGMPADVAAKLAAFGREFDGRIAQQTAAIYASVPRVYTPAEIEVVKDLAYGPHERQRLDVHRSTVRRNATGAPIVVAFHGGGLIGGSRAAMTNVADYFASIGYIGVNGGYRLAPDAKWPEGGRDVGAAVTWLAAHAAEYGGDPRQIFVIGISTGALHAATMVFRPELMPAGTARPAGAILVSGPYTFDFEHPSPGELAYFGEERARWQERVVTGHVARTDIPVLMTTAEWDHPRYTGPFATLFNELVLGHGATPRYFQSLGHNHSSQLLSLGTADTSVSSVIVDFIERTAGR
jgi:triacylglycerol lipase